MFVSLYVDTREILLPTLDIVHGHCGVGVNTTGDHHSVRVGVRDGAGLAAKNNVTLLIIISKH